MDEKPNFGELIQEGYNKSSSSIKDRHDNIQEEDRTLNNDKSAMIKEEIEDLRHFRDLRSDISSKVFCFLVSWCVSLLVLIVSDASRDDFEIPEIVLVTLCGGTTVSTIGLVGFIVQGLFNHKK